MTTRTAPPRLIRRLVCFTALLLLTVSICSYALRRSVASASQPGKATVKEAAWSPAPSPGLDFGGGAGLWGSPSLFLPAPAGPGQASGLIGLEGVSVGSTQAVVDSFDSAKGAYGPGNKGSAAILISNGAVSIEGSKVYGDVRSTASSVTLKSSSLVTGGVTAGTKITNGGTIKGAATPNSPSAPVAAQVVAPCSPFGPAGSISGKFTYNTPKGDLNVNGPATLAAGAYCFHNLTLSGGGKLATSGPVTIRLTGQLAASGNSAANAGGVPATLQVLSSYEGADGVVLSGTTDLYMTIYAPQAGVRLTGTPQLYGAVLGKTLGLNGNPSLHFDTQLAASAVNAAPVVNAGSSQTVTLPATATLSGGATDDGLPNPPGALTYQWSQVSGPAAASIATPTQATTAVNFTAAGAYVFSLTASDGALGGSASVQVNVNPPVNHAPVVSAGTNQTITLPASATLSASANDDGLPNPPGALAFQWSQLSGPAQASIASPSQPTTAVSFTAAGAYVFQFTASDGALSSSATVQVTVNPRVNQAPTVGAGANQTITLPATASLNGSVGDDGLPSPPAALTLAWSQVSGPSPALVAAPTQAATSAAFTQPGTYVLQLTADDGARSSSATTQVTVFDGPPTLAPLPDRTIPAGTKYSMRLSADDPNTNDTLSYFLDSAPAGATFDPNPVVVWTPTSAQLGANDFSVRVVDAAGHTDSRTFHITVVAANHPPQLAEQADERVPSGGHFSRTLVATDPDGDATTLALVKGPAGLTLTGNQLSWNPVTTTPGDYPVTVKVSDPAGLIDSKRFNVSVFAASAPAVRDDFYETSLGQTLSVQASGVLANDADPNGGALAAAKLTNPDKGSVSAFNADGSFTYVAPPSPGGPVLDVTRSIAIAGGSPLGVSPLLVADVDGDGKPDIITNEGTGPDTALHVYRGDTGEQLFAFDTLPPAQVGGLPCNGFSSGFQTFAAADIDDDGKVEIVRATNCSGSGDPFGQTRIVAVAYDLSLPEHFRVKWLSAPILPDTSTNIPTASSFTVARLHPGDKPSVLLGGSVLHACSQILSTSTDAACRGVWALNGADGSLQRMYYSAPANQSNVSAYAQGFSTAQGGFMAPVVADVDNDGAQDILYEGTLWNADGTVKRQFDSTSDRPFSQSSAVVDLDGDAQMEVVTLDAAYNGGGTGQLQAWKADGRRLWQMPVPRSTVATKLSVADVDRDGRPDIIFGIFNTIWVVDSSGRIKWLRNMSGPADSFSFQFSQGRYGAASFPVYDLNGDGTPEMVVQYGNNTLRFLRADTGEDETSWTLPGSPVWNGGNYVDSPVVADVDGSGHASVLFQHEPVFAGVGNETLVQVLRGDTAAWRPAPTHYNQQAYWESNFNADGSVPATYPRQTSDPRTNVFGQQPQAPYAPGFVPASDTSFTYSATNAAGLSSTARVNIHVTPQNRAPKFTSKPPAAYLNNTPFDYQAHAVDPDLGDTITYALIYADGNNAGASINPATGLLHSNLLFQGEQNFIISATDNHGATSYQPFVMHMAAGTTSVPDLFGAAQADAASSLAAAHLSVGDITQQHANAPAGTVLGQSPGAGATLPQGETVDLTVSLGPAPVAVPNVVGNAKTVAVTTLSTNGFTAAVTPVFSDTVPAGTVISQSPLAGTFLAPTPANPVALTVSAGNGLRVSLDRPVATADQTIKVTPQAFDLSGSPTPLPPLSYSITPKQTPFTGPLPTISGATINLDPATVGSFTVTVTDAANSRSAGADFAVLPPRVPGQVTNGESFAHMSEVLSQIHALRPQLQAALAADDTAEMTSLLRQIVTLWRTIDIDDLRISVPLATADKFPPTVEMMIGFGESPTPDDVVSHQVLQDSVADLDAWTEGLKTSGLTVAQLDALADQFSTRAARIDGLVVSRYGGVNNSPLYTRLMSNSIPDFYEALTNELAQLTGMPRRDASFPLQASNGAGRGPGALSSPSLLAGRSKRRRGAASHRVRFVNAAYRRAPAQGSLAELLVTEATQMIVDKIMEAASQPYKNAKQYAVDVMAQAAWTAQAVKEVGEVRDSINGKTVDEVFSGASLSFREFLAAPGWIEADAAADPKLNNVFIIGPNLASSRVDEFLQAKDLYDKLKDKDVSGAYQNLNERKTDLSKLLTAIKNSYTNPDDPLAPEAKLALQSPDEVLNGCLLPRPGNAAACRQLVYHNGFAPVYAYSPPPGFGTLGGLPVGIIFVVHNKADGVMSFGTPPFLPCSYTDGSPKKIQCPNNTPFPP